jgi:hypothetical protein
MSEAHDHERPQEAAASKSPPFRFEGFADAVSARAAFEAAYAVGSPIELALKALMEMGAQCKAVNPTRVACRYVEAGSALAQRCWYLSLACDREKAIQRINIAVGITAL